MPFPTAGCAHVNNAYIDNDHSKIFVYTYKILVFQGKMKIFLIENEIILTKKPDL